MNRYLDRVEAGTLLAALVSDLHLVDPAVIALPRGGLLVAIPVATALAAPLDLLIVRKLGVPFQPELAMGAIAEGGAEVVDRELVRRLGVSENELQQVRKAERAELDRRITGYRRGRPPIDLSGHPVVVIDDGLATGLTALVAAEALRRRQATEVILAIPVAPASAIDRMRAHFDRVVCPLVPARFRAVGEWYEDFRQVTDAEVTTALDAATLPR